jgi:hypothetical protein
MKANKNITATSTSNITSNNAHAKKVSPAWQAKLDGAISLADYNAIIAGKTTLEEALGLTKKHVVTKKSPAKKAKKSGWKVSHSDDGKTIVKFAKKHAKKGAKKSASKADYVPVTLRATKIDRAAEDYSKYNF